MTLTVEDDFREFVVACWPDLESAAFLVTLDPERARVVTAESLADLHQRWREALDEGVPGARARSAVLTAAVGATSLPRPGRPGRPVSGGSPVVEDDPPAPSEEGPDEQADAVVDALVTQLRAATPLERAVVAGRAVWAMAPEEVAGSLGAPVGSVRAAAASLHVRLATAHDAARDAQGLPPAEWALERDVADAVDVLLRGVPDPPDPAALVSERRRVVRRRSLLVAGAGAALLTGAGAWWLSSDRPAGPTPGSAAATLPGPDDPRWARTSTWHPRGVLASDLGVQALVIARTASGSRLLWADDVGDRRLVVAVALDYSLSPGSDLRVWHGPRGADPRALEDAPLTLTTIEGVRDVVALTLPQGFRGLGRSASTLVVLGRPTVRSASFSRLVRPTTAGTIERDWVELPLKDGVAATVLPDPVSAAMRIRVAGFDGPPATTDPLWLGRDLVDVAPAAFTRAVHTFVQRVTGIPATRLRTEVVADSPVSGSILDATAISATDGDGRVVALRTVTPEGAVLSSVVVTDDGRAEGGAVVLRPAHVLLAESASDPIVERVSDMREGFARYLVVAPGAASVQMRGTSQSAYPLSEPVATKGKAAAVVPVRNAGEAATFRVVTRDAAGNTLFDGVPAATRFLLDLWS